MNLGEIVIRIRAHQSAYYGAVAVFGNRVGGAVEFALAQENSVKEEMAFVIPLAEADQGDNQYDNGTNQMVNERFGVVVALKNDTSVVDKLGIGAYDRLAGVRTQLWRALLGWLPTGMEMPIYYKGGRLLDINPAWLWYQFEFQSEFHLTAGEAGVDDEQIAAITDDFLHAYAQWLVGDHQHGILPMQGTPPLLPQSLIPPDMESLIDFKYGFSAGFSKGFDTLEADAAQ